MKIGDRTITRAIQQVQELLIDNQLGIDRAYLKDQDLTITITIKFKPPKYPPGINVETAIAFITERVKDKMETTVIEGDLPLFRPGARPVPIHLAFTDAFHYLVGKEAEWYEEEAEGPEPKGAIPIDTRTVAAKAVLQDTYEQEARAI